MRIRILLRIPNTDCYFNFNHGIVQDSTVILPIEFWRKLICPICRDIQWSTGEDTPGMGDEIEAAYEDFLRGQS
jgi:hypothetical protein